MWLSVALVYQNAWTDCAGGVRSNGIMCCRNSNSGALVNSAMSAHLRLLHKAAGYVPGTPPPHTHYLPAPPPLPTGLTPMTSPPPHPSSAASAGVCLHPPPPTPSGWALPSTTNTDASLQNPPAHWSAVRSTPPPFKYSLVLQSKWYHLSCAPPHQMLPRPCTPPGPTPMTSPPPSVVDPAVPVLTEPPRLLLRGL